MYDPCSVVDIFTRQMEIKPLRIFAALLWLYRLQSYMAEIEHYLWNYFKGDSQYYDSNTMFKWVFIHLIFKRCLHALDSFII